jgi:hypothetical protein
MMKTTQIQTIVKAKLKEDYDTTFPLSLWFINTDFEEKVIDETQVEKRILCEYIDIPDVYHYTHENF